jgi:hypothetical protein
MATGSYPATDLPPLARDASSDKILKHLMTRIQTVEGALKSQELKNEMFSKAYEQDKQTNDRFDELTHRVVLLERNMNSDKKRLTKLETNLFTVLSTQSKMENAIKLMDQKIIALIRKHSFNHSPSGTAAAGGGGGGVSSSAPSPGAPPRAHSSISRLPSLDGDGTDLFEYSPHDEQLELDNILHASIGDFHSPLDPAEFQVTSSLPSAPKYESPVVREKKELLRAISLKKSQSCGAIDEESPLPSGRDGEGNGNGEDGGAVDSQALMEEFLLEKIEALDLVVHEEILHTMASQQETIAQLSKQLHEIQTNGALLQKPKSSETVWQECQEEEMRVLGHEMDAMLSLWREVYDEVDVKVGKIEFLMKQVQKTAGDEIYGKLCGYRVFLKEQLNIISSQLGEERRSKEEMVRVMVPFFDELIARSEEIQEMESALQRGNNSSGNGNISDGHNATGIPPMAISRSSSHLPEKILQATEETLPLMEHKYLKHQFQKELRSLQETVDSLTNQHKDNPLTNSSLLELLTESDMKLQQLQQEQQEISRKFLEWQQNSLQNSSQLKETISKNYSEIMKRITTVSQLSNKNSEVNQKIEKLTQELQELHGKIQENGREDVEMLLDTFMNEMKFLKRSVTENEIHLIDKLKRKADHHEIEKYILPSSSASSPSLPLFSPPPPPPCHRLYGLISGVTDLSSQQGPPAIIHSKCLVCDKPVNPLAYQVPRETSSTPPPPQQQQYASPDSPPRNFSSAYYDKREDTQLYPSTTRPSSPAQQTKKQLFFVNRPSTSGPSIGRSQQGGKISKTQLQLHLQHQQSSNNEANILRNSMEYLPPVNTTTTTTTGGAGNNGSAVVSDLPSFVPSHTTVLLLFLLLCRLLLLRRREME